MQDEEKQKLFERAYQNNLSPSERTNFDQLLSENPSLNEEFENFQEEVLLVGALGFRSQVGETLKDINQKKNNNKKRYYMVGIIAAATLLFGIFITIPSKQNPESLFYNNFEVLPDILSNRSDLSAQTSKALFAYNSGDFEKSQTLFKQISTKSDTIYLYLAICTLKNDQPQNANVYLRNISSENFTPEKNWYLGLTHLLLNQQDSTTLYFNKVPERSRYYPRTRTILENLVE